MDMTGLDFDNTGSALPPPVQDIIQEVGNTVSGGIPRGLPLSVPVGWAAVVSRGAQVLYALAPGNYLFEPQNFPLLAQPRHKQGEHLLNGAIHFVRMTDMVEVPWECGISLTSDRQNGMTYCRMRGRFWGRVTDPGRFYATMLQIRNAAKAANKALVSSAPSLTALPLLSETLGAAAERGAVGAGVPPSQWMMAQEHVRAASAQAAIGQMVSMGVSTLGFQVDDASDALRVPCVGCGSLTAPTNYATFRRNVSLFYVRFGTEQSGNYCPACATKRLLMDNGIMLVCGWWGIIGLVLTPIYMVSNLYNWGVTLIGAKQSTAQSERRLTA